MANNLTRTRKQSYFVNVWNFDVDGAGNWAPWSGGRLSLGAEVASDFGGGTIQFQWSSDKVSIFNLGPAVSTVAGLNSFAVPPGFIRPVLTGSTSPVLKIVLV